MNPKVFKVMDEHMERLKSTSKEVEHKLGQKINYKPFFSSIAADQSENYQVEIVDGGLHKTMSPPKMSFNTRIEMRMGHPKKGGSADYVTKFGIPYDLNFEASRNILIQKSDKLFWDCSRDFLKRENKGLGDLEENCRENYLYFSKENPEVFIQEEEEFDFEGEKGLEGIISGLKQISKDLMRPWLRSSETYFSATKENYYFVNSEGTKIFKSNKRYLYEIYLSSVDKKNFVVPHSFRVYSRSLIDLNQLNLVGEVVLKELEEILKAPIGTNGAFPVILDQINNGLLFHEVVGHDLEAHRIQNGGGSSESNVFKNKIGKKVAPGFVNLSDNPIVKSYRGTDLNGYYLYDDEGIKSRNTVLFENGILRNYLHSRQSAGFFKTKSNGHCRAAPGSEPCSRMGTLFVSSSNPTESFDDLKKMLIKECERQGKSFGYYLKDFNSGLSDSQEAVYWTFPESIFKIHKNGRIQRVRNINVIGTPHQTLENIGAMDANYKVTNGFCGAESGLIPSSEVAPNAFVKKLEFNKIADEYLTKAPVSVYKKYKTNP